MSLQPVGAGEVPAETARVARAAFPKGSLAIRIRDELGVLFTDEQFAGLFPARGKPAWSPGRLALVSVLQFVEGLPDRQAADAVRARVDWKYALNLELTDPGFDHSVLSEFRDRLVAAGGGRELFDRVLGAARDAGLLRSGGRSRTDATHVPTSIRSLKRLEFVIETVRSALNALAAAAPEWLSTRALPDWFDAETCEPDIPNLLTDVTTTVSTAADDRMIPVVHARLAEQELLPGEHWADGGSSTPLLCLLLPASTASPCTAP